MLPLLIRPALQAGSYVQVQVVLAANIANYRRQVQQERASRGAGLLTWTYGGWLSIDRDFVFDRANNPEAALAGPDRASSADCRWLREHFYDCALDY